MVEWRAEIASPGPSRIALEPEIAREPGMTDLLDGIRVEAASATGTVDPKSAEAAAKSRRRRGTALEADVRCA
jgi:hypothetical protein